MRNKIYALFLFVLSGLLLTRCSKTNSFSSEPLSDYLNLSVGNYITYRMDSLVYINFGQNQTTHSYLAKDVVDGTTTDNLGRLTWRINRFITDTAAAGPWVQTMTYFITPTREEVEVIENNFRYIKLQLPVTTGVTWKGNSYIDTYSVNSDVRYMDDWDYTYTSVGQSYTPYTTPVPNAAVISQRDETLGTPNNLDAYSERNFAMEVYGKGIGLIYKSFIHWVFQPRNSTYPNGYYEGSGITLRMIDHN